MRPSDASQRQEASAGRMRLKAINGVVRRDKHRGVQLPSSSFTSRSVRRRDIVKVANPLERQCPSPSGRVPAATLTRLCGSGGHCGAGYTKLLSQSPHARVLTGRMQFSSSFIIVRPRATKGTARKSACPEWEVEGFWKRNRLFTQHPCH